MNKWNVVGLINYGKEVVEDPFNYNFWKIEANIPVYDDMGDPTGETTTSLVASGQEVIREFENKFYTFNYLTGDFYDYVTHKNKELVDNPGDAYARFKDSWQDWLNDNQVWINKLTQALNILDNPADNYNKRIHSIMTFNGSEKNELTPTGIETTTSTRTGKQTETITKSGKETSQFNKGAEEYKSYRTTMNSNDPKLTDKNETVATLPNNVAYKDETTTIYGGNAESDTRKDTSELEYTNLRDAVTKEFTNRKDTDTKTFLNRYDDYVMREWGNIGVTTYAKILSELFNVANTTQLFDYLIHDFVERNCIL